MCLFTVVVFLFVYSLIQCIYRSSSVCVCDFKNRKMVLLIKFAFFVLSSTNPEFLEHPPARKRSKSTRAPHGGGVKCARSNCSWCTGAELWHPQTLLKWLLDNRSRQSEDISKRDTTLALNVTKHVFPDSRHQIMHHTLYSASCCRIMRWEKQLRRIAQLYSEYQRENLIHWATSKIKCLRDAIRDSGSLISTWSKPISFTFTQVLPGNTLYQEVNRKIIPAASLLLGFQKPVKTWKRHRYWLDKSSN